MGRVFLRYSFITIGVYLVAVYATGAGKILDTGSGGGVRLIKAFQGR